MKTRPRGLPTPAVLGRCARSLALVSLLGVSAPARADLFVYTDEALYLADVAALGYQLVQESFEDDAVWGPARSPNTVPSLTAMGITWLPNNAISELTTGGGAARSGAWGLYELPHGDPLSGINDGWVGQTPEALFGVGGWIRTNTPFAEIDMVLDGTTIVGFNPSIVGTGHAFFGVIETAGFTQWEIRELNGGPGDQKFIFSDDFSFAVPGLFSDGFESGDTSAWSTTVP